MLIEFDLDHLYFPGSDAVMDLQSARELVQCLVRLNLIYLTRARDLGKRIPRLYDSGVRYGEVNTWEAIPTVYRKRLTDCKNLTPIVIAEKLFYEGVRTQPAFRWVENADGTVDYHILVQNGSEFQDPSLDLGMNQADAAKFYAE